MLRLIRSPELEWPFLLGQDEDKRGQILKRLFLSLSSKLSCSDKFRQPVMERSSMLPEARKQTTILSDKELPPVLIPVGSNPTINQRLRSFLHYLFYDGFSNATTSRRVQKDLYKFRQLKQLDHTSAFKPTWTRCAQWSEKWVYELCLQRKFMWCDPEEIQHQGLKKQVSTDLVNCRSKDIQMSM